MFSQLKRYFGKVAFAEGETSFGYRELYLSICRLSETLAERIGRGNELAVCMSHSVRYAIYSLAAVRAGCKVYLLHPGIGKNTLDILSKSRVMIYLDADNYEHVSKLYDGPYELVNDNDYSYEIGYEPDDNNSYDFMGSLIFSTSGTTSDKVKFINIPFLNIYLKSEMIAEKLHISGEDSNLLVSPLCFIQSFWAMLIHLLRGAKVCIERFSPAQFGELLKQHEITTFVTTPSIIRGVIGQTSDTYKLRLLCVGGDYLDKNTLEMLRKKWENVSFANVYGTTETAAADAIFGPEPLKDFNEKYYTLGQQTKYSKVFILKDDGTVAGLYEEGDICIQSPFLSDRYYKSDLPMRNEHGYFVTYDRGYLDSEGFLHFCGRKAGMIVCNGKKISSYEVENTIYRIRGIKEAVVIGERHEIYGEIAVAYIAAEDYVTEEHIREYLYEMLDKHKVPKKIVLLENLKFTNSGKIIRNANAYS